MAKYDPLAHGSLRLSFDEIEALAGAQLPHSARLHREWWWLAGAMLVHSRMPWSAETLLLRVRCGW
jgi:hypothetical protein